MIYDKQKNEEIKALKRFRKLKDQSQYMGFKKALILKYNVTGRTIEMWLAKRTPGARKVRTDSGKVRNKITAKEKKVAAELLEQGTKIKDVKKVVGVSKRKLDRIRDQVNMGAEADYENGDIDKETNFGDKAKEMFRKLFQLDLIAPDRGILVEAAGKRIRIQKGDVEDICLILANAYNRLGIVKYKLDKMQFMKMRVIHLVEGQINILNQNGGATKEVESLTRMYDRLNEPMAAEVNLDLLKTICRILKPNISDTEIYELVKSNAPTDE